MRPILIVEDEPAIADLIEMTLEPLGQPLIKAHTGNEAANLLESTLFDLILLDVMLPGVDGFTLMDYIVAQSWLQFMEAGKAFAFSKQFEERIAAVTVDSVNAALRRMVVPENVTWILSGDLAKAGLKK